jgi:hypothetical protein
MADIPDRSNFYSTLQTDLSSRQVAQLYEAAGWQSRRCNWTDYELVGPLAELVIKEASPLLLCGAVADIRLNLESVLMPLRLADVSFSAECYDANGELLQKVEG